MLSSLPFLLCTPRSKPNIIETNKTTHMKTCTQIKKTRVQIVGNQMQNNNKQNMFFLYVLKFQNTKDETP